MATETATAPADTTTEIAQLAKADKVKVPEVITTPAQYAAGLSNWTSQYNVLTPFTAISGIAPQHGIVRSVVQMDLRVQYAGETGPSGGDLYGGAPWLKGGRRGADDEAIALAKGGLRKLAECAGISTRTERTDPYTIPHYWSFRAIASYRGIDGAVVTREATMEWDLRDGSERINGWTASQIKEGRKNGLRSCETRAINAAIRECGCGVKQSYTRGELKKPFLVLRIAFQPDMNDPDQRRLVAEHGLRSTSTLYGPPALPAGAAHHDETVDGDMVEGQPKTVGKGTAAPAEPAADLPPVEGAVRIVDVRSKNGTSKNGKPWTRFLITDSQGVEHSTFSETLAQVAAEFKVSKAWVEIDVREDGDYKNLAGIHPAGQQPKLPNPEDL